MTPKEAVAWIKEFTEECPWWLWLLILVALFT